MKSTMQCCPPTCNKVRSEGRGNHSAMLSSDSLFYGAKSPLLELQLKTDWGGGGLSVCLAGDCLETPLTKVRLLPRFVALLHTPIAAQQSCVGGISLAPLDLPLLSIFIKVDISVRGTPFLGSINYFKISIGWYTYRYFWCFILYRHPIYPVYHLSYMQTTPLRQ